MGMSDLEMRLAMEGDATLLQRENAELRTRLQNTEDALRREVRKTLNAPTSCPSCGCELKAKPAVA
jgi:hypothetical protein